MNEANLALRQLASSIKAQLVNPNIKNFNVAIDLADAGTAITAIWGTAGQVTVALNTQGGGSFNVSVQMANGGVNVHAGPLSLLPAVE
jgi:hypothetical protein